MNRVNDLVIKIATVNGTGSASANGLLMKSLFRMGIPVSGKNLFPSNIQGLPTWYEIRANADGHTGRCPDIDIMVAMNKKTYAQDLEEVRAGGYVLYDSSWPLPKELLREDVTFISVPLARMCVENFEESRERILMKNIAYVGALAALLNIELDVIENQFQEKFSSKPKLLDSNHQAVMLGYEYAKEQIDCPLPLHLERMDANDDYIMIDGNTAAGLGCMYAGATVAAWYPITPSTSLFDAFTRFCHKYRKDPETGRNRFCIIQSEDEIAAIGIVLGASWNGARAFTSTSGPGISLMNECIGLGYYAEIPAVIFDIQRVGPSTGMPTRTQQGDILSCAHASHGDTEHIVLFPANPEECFHLSVEAFDLAERFQTPVFVLSDLDIAMNDWRTKKIEWDDNYTPDRGKVLGEAELEKMEAFHRYLDLDGDGIAARTLPGETAKGSYFLRGSGHNKHGIYTENPDEYQEVIDRLKRKMVGAREKVPAPIIQTRPGANTGIISLGSCDPAVREALAKLERAGIPLDYLRVRAFPFAASVGDFIESYDRVYVVEQNRDGQLRTLLINQLEAPPQKLVSLLAYGGMPMSAKDVLAGIEVHPLKAPEEPRKARV